VKRTTSGHISDQVRLMRCNHGRMRLILRLLANAGALAVATWLLAGITLTAPTTGQKVFTLLIVALIFGIVNAIVKPIFTLVTAVAVLLTLGLFLIVINALMLLLTSWISDQVNLGWHVEGFWTAVLGSIIISVVSFIVNAFIPEKDEDRRDRR
jgi:putative membrane protein